MIPIICSTCACTLSRFSLTLCNPMDCSLPGSSVDGIFQGRILEWVAMPSSRGSSQPRDQTSISCRSRMKVKTLIRVRLFATLWSPLGSPVHGIFQARILAWVALSYSRGSFLSRDKTHIFIGGKWVLNF